MSIREVTEGLNELGTVEEIIFQLTTTGVGSDPTTTSAAIWSVDSTGTITDVTSTNMTGSTSVSGDVITLPTISGLTDGQRYRVNVKYTVSGNVVENFFWIDSDR